jgi:hypothetical protein
MYIFDFFPETGTDGTCHRHILQSRFCRFIATNAEIRLSNFYAQEVCDDQQDHSGTEYFQFFVFCLVSENAVLFSTCRLKNA